MIDDMELFLRDAPLDGLLEELWIVFKHQYWVDHLLNGIQTLITKKAVRI